ncbi:SGNH/GDSL hydrolase family protein [Streptomyces sp. NPDC006879]|uniref:SGNH/GDSL hydrolase family protein n=1 Tax=Streptomyces sp. NPDC006879 TaxID=3364767 RepID=UPI0036B627E9
MRDVPERFRERSRLKASIAGTLLLVGALTGCQASGADNAGARASRTAVASTPSATPAWNPAPASIAAVGDSITRGFDACSVLADCPEASWATGDDPQVRSLATRLREDTEAAAEGAENLSWNLARTGARVADLAAQMNAAAQYRPELVTVMIGANDACRTSVDAMTPAPEFQEAFRRALVGLRAQLPKTQVYVSSVPDLRRLWEQGRGSELSTRVWKLGICPSMLADPEAHDTAANARRAAVRSRVIEYNRALQEVCDRDELCRYDGGAVFRYPFTTAQLSTWDWFHPGIDGQARLAELAHRQITTVR